MYPLRNLNVPQFGNPYARLNKTAKRPLNVHEAKTAQLY